MTTIAVENSVDDLTSLKSMTLIDAMIGRATEATCGIELFLGSHSGFSGVVKRNPCDFIVKEIDNEQHIVSLTDFTIPDELLQKDIEMTNEALDERYVRLENITDYTTADRVRNLLSSSSTEESVCFPCRDDKQQRGQQHHLIKSMFPELSSDTITVDIPSSTGADDGGKHSKSVRVYLSQKNKNVQSLKRRADGTPMFDKRSNYRSTFPYISFTLYKSGVDSIEAIGRISHVLGMTSTKAFGYAGTKDKVAITTQRCSVYRCDVKRLASLNNHPRFREGSIQLGNFCGSMHGIKLGELHGNRFTITIREVSEARQNVECAIKSISSTGFINYFGLQRFGSGDIPTYRVGLAILKGEWERACHLILWPKGADSRGRDRYNSFKSGSLETALSYTPRHLTAEFAILSFLVNKNNKDFFGALNAIPRGLRTMYLHSFQSFIWNKSASTRIRLLGSTPCEGDLVIVNEEKSTSSNLIVVDDTADEAAETPACDTTDIGLCETLYADKNVNVRVITLEDILKHVYSIYDIVLPLPGASVSLPQNKAGDSIADFLRDNGMSMSHFAPPLVNRNFMLHGGYRRIIEKPGDQQWEYIEYTDSNIPLTPNDLDVLRGNSGMPSDVSPLEASKRSALVTSFNLAPSSYATMYLRELMKQATN